jgi:hypothetical protein
MRSGVGKGPWIIESVPDNGRGSGYLILVLTERHRWALSPISVISDILLSLISELPISD